MSVSRQTTDDIRAFNRFYTGILGLLDQHILHSAYSLTEARVLFEINELHTCTANTLVSKLGVDKSYMSRIVAGFLRKGLIVRHPSEKDSRAYLIELTKAGQQEIDELSRQSERQIERLLAPMDDEAREEVRAAMRLIQNRLTQTGARVAIRPFLHTQEETEYIISRQIRLYETEYGFTSDVWKAYVADGVHSLVDHFSPDKDCVCLLEATGTLSGCIAIAHAQEDFAQLRFFFAEPSLRGAGAGERLIGKALDFCREHGYRHVFLWTCSSLAAARHLYEKHGFSITQTHENGEWGQMVTEERWDLDL